jgi:hypothetical protein
MSIVPFSTLVEDDLRSSWTALLDGQIDALAYRPPSLDNLDVDYEPGPGLSGSTNAPAIRAIFPGAFNPLHIGHLAMHAAAQQRLGFAAHFEISVTNVDKAAIELPDALARLKRFEPGHNVLLTRAPTFLEKCRRFPNVTFVVGADTVVRIGERRYYTSAIACDEALADIVKAQCRFLVFGRMSDSNSQFMTLETLSLPGALRTICDEITEKEFRIDLSSTALRERAEVS